MTTSDALRCLGEMAYRAGVGPRPSAVPDQGLVAAVEGDARGQPGRALDLGCGTGRNTIYLAWHGWDVTGVEIAGNMLVVARSNADAAGVRPRFVQGDVTRLADLNIGEDYQLLIDGGCYHMVPQGRRDGYVAGVTTVAARGAFLIMVGFTRVLGSGMAAEEVQARFRGWDLVDTQRISAEEMQGYVSKPAPLRAALKKGWFAPYRYRLQRH